MSELNHNKALIRKFIDAIKKDDTERAINIINQLYHSQEIDYASLMSGIPLIILPVIYENFEVISYLASLNCDVINYRVNASKIRELCQAIKHDPHNIQSARGNLNILDTAICLFKIETTKKLINYYPQLFSLESLRMIMMFYSESLIIETTKLILAHSSLKSILYEFPLKEAIEGRNLELARWLMKQGKGISNELFSYENLLNSNDNKGIDLTKLILEFHPNPKSILSKFTAVEAIARRNFELAKWLINQGINLTLEDLFPLDERDNLYGEFVEYGWDYHQDFITLINFLIEIGITVSSLFEISTIPLFIVREEIEELFYLVKDHLDKINIEDIASEVATISSPIRAFEFLHACGVKLTKELFQKQLDEFSEQYLPGDNKKIVDLFVLNGVDLREVFGEDGSLEDTELSRYTPSYYQSLFVEQCNERNLEYILNLLYLRPQILLPLCNEKFLDMISRLDNVSIQNYNGNTLMHFALHFKRLDIAKAISNKIISLEVKNDAGESPRDLLNALRKSAEENQQDKNIVVQFDGIFAELKNNPHFEKVVTHIHKEALENFSNSFATIQHFEKLQIILKSMAAFTKIASSFEMIGEFLGMDELVRLSKTQAKAVISINQPIVTHDVEHDGNCFFHVIAESIGTSHEEVRAEAINYIIENIEHFAEFMEQHSSASLEGRVNYYINTMSKQRTWADHLIIQAVADRFNISIEILNPDLSQHGNVIIPRDGEVNQNIIAIYTGDHYYAGYCMLAEDEATAINNSRVEITQEEESQLENASVDEDFYKMALQINSTLTEEQQHFFSSSFNGDFISFYPDSYHQL